MKFGIIYTSYGYPEYLIPSLTPWAQVKFEKPNGDEFVISAVSLPFKEHKDISPIDNKTPTLLHNLVLHEKIDYLTASPDFIAEAEARSLALNPLLMENCDYIIQVDGDEFYTVEEINKIIEFVKKNPMTTWFRGSLKNYVFDDKTYLTQPFNPPRIHKVEFDGFRIEKFIQDNDIVYHDHDQLQQYPQNNFSNLVIPKNIAWTKHLSWLDNESSGRKVRYQESRNWKCSFKYDDISGLQFNDEFPIPEIQKD